MPSKPIYKVLTLDTAAARNGATIIPVGEGYDGIEIISMPAGLVPLMSFSGNADAAHNVPMAVGQQRRFVDECNNPFLVTEPLLLTHNAVVGNIVIVISQGVQH